MHNVKIHIGAYVSDIAWLLARALLFWEVSCVTQLTCLTCDTAGISALKQIRHVCLADSAVGHIRHVTCLLWDMADMLYMSCLL